MVAISSTSDLTNDCTIPGCTSLGIILVGGKLGAGEMALLCTMHYHKLLARMKEEGMDEDDTDTMSAEDILSMTTGNEFQRIVRRLVDEESFKTAVKKAAKKGTPKQGKLF